MARKIIALIFAAVLMFTVTGCEHKQDNATEEAAMPTGETTAEQVNTGFSTDGDGYYDLLADITVGFG